MLGHEIILGNEVSWITGLYKSLLPLLMGHFLNFGVSGERNLEVTRKENTVIEFWGREKKIFF